MPEAYILSTQMENEVKGKKIVSVDIRNCAKLQKIGFVNKDITDFDKISGGKIETITSRGNVIRVKLNNGMNLLLAPEYGGKILYHTKEPSTTTKFHLMLRFSDDTALTVTLTGMGIIQALKDETLKGSYVYKRDFSSTVSPTDEGKFTFEGFSKKFAAKNVNIKSALVGKDAVLVGLSNSAFQDILYRAKIHPKRKASSLNESEKLALFEAILLVIHERIRLGGKTQFVDFYGKKGSYAPTMGPDMKGKFCPACGAQVEKFSLGGGQIYYCPRCQK